MSGTFTETEIRSYVVVRCYLCDVSFGLPDTLQQRRRNDGKEWFCPNGHGQVYKETEADRLRKQLETEQRRVIQLRSERDAASRNREAAERSASAFKGQATRLRKRIGNGVCPCCNRHFSNVERHISNKHPEFVGAEATE